MVFKKLPDGAVYNGEWHNCQPEGYGAMTYTDGSRYEGTWHEGQRDGTGKYVCPDYEFHGTWRHNRPNGQGVKTWKTAGVYDGWFVNGLREGSGTMTWTKTGRKYTGQWRGDRMNGRGICHWPDGTWYDGEWSVLDGERHGHGKYTYADGSTYTGLYQKGLKHGAGVLVTTTHVYRGTWKENRFEGEFTVTVRATGVKSKVRYKNGKKQ
ncbi:predicted protein [Aspergillus terreus NIH2624]|uniref:MORN repeat protein n=1 Tax=Aspergillus terreus (strain NIH 2624 / FGSC A1156) TaxID=341663 RepID=Q0C983_ASPTN|nr:uncharacterized protein ATEG_09751 [Aspergillus terreus NIH2624]EAU29942.1 predicted protein [Aspergillus terreus NIH2624]